MAGPLRPPMLTPLAAPRLGVRLALSGQRGTVRSICTHGGTAAAFCVDTLGSCASPQCASGSGQRGTVRMAGPLRASVLTTRPLRLLCVL
eukprot:scaffold56794_cov57-Phaeocystis_antarctica.AAC.3